MSTYRELTYMVLDELKILSDDSYITEDHIIYLLDKYRAALLYQKYSNIKLQIPESNYQTICLDLEETPAISGVECEGDSFLKSKQKIPYLMTIGNQKAYPISYFYGEIAYVSRDRMRYVGYNRYLQNVIYCSLGPDSYLYFKSCNPQFLHLKKIKFTGIFQDTLKASELACKEEQNTNCDILDKQFPIEEELISILIQSVVKEVTGAIYKPEDKTNDANDDLSDIMAFVRRNMKSNMQKTIEGDGQ